jgi:tRNA(His) 5'-end guanylyltransferase
MINCVERHAEPKRDEFGDPFKAKELHARNKVYGDYIGVRIDGKAFHTYTKKFAKPFDERITDAMNFTTFDLCRNTDIPVLFAYTQSDEISLLLRGEGWFHDTQKISSICASYATAFFGRRQLSDRPAVFDARVFALGRDDVVDYFKWRKMDANRNAISAVAQSLYSHKELQGKGKAELLKMIDEKKPEALPIPERNFNGSYFYPVATLLPVEYVDNRTNRIESTMATRRVWRVDTDNGMLDLLESDVLN